MQANLVKVLLEKNALKLLLSWIVQPIIRNNIPQYENCSVRCFVLSILEHALANRSQWSNTIYYFHKYMSCFSIVYNKHIYEKPVKIIQLLYFRNNFDWIIPLHALSAKRIDVTLNIWTYARWIQSCHHSALAYCQQNSCSAASLWQCKVE